MIWTYQILQVFRKGAGCGWHHDRRSAIASALDPTEQALNEWTWLWPKLISMHC